MQGQTHVRLAQARRGRKWLYSAAALSTVAGLIHLLAMLEHFIEWSGYGLFFLVVALAQLYYVPLLLTRRRGGALLVAGIVGNSLIVGLYLVTRTAGIPLGPQAGEVEVVGFADLLCMLAELALIACLCVQLRKEAASG
jgi:hypothetical protein